MWFPSTFLLKTPFNTHLVLLKSTVPPKALGALSAPPDSLPPPPLLEKYYAEILFFKAVDCSCTSTSWFLLKCCLRLSFLANILPQTSQIHLELGSAFFLPFKMAHDTWCLWRLCFLLKLLPQRLQLGNMVLRWSRTWFHCLILVPQTLPHLLQISEGPCWYRDYRVWSFRDLLDRRFPGELGMQCRIGKCLMYLKAAPECDSSC